MLSVPIALAFVAITIGPATMPLSAIVSVPVPKLPMFTPELFVEVEPARVTVRCRSAIFFILGHVNRRLCRAVRVRC